MKYNLIRDPKRKRMQLRVLPDGTPAVYAPVHVPKKAIDEFVAGNADWIRVMQEKQRSLSAVPQLTEQEMRELGDRAVQIIPERVQHYAPLVGVTYGRITLRWQKTRWGSCSAKGNLNFNCLLMLAPPEVLDAVVVHELCHRLHMNHSQAFYAEVLRVCPEYRRWEAWLHRNGAQLQAKVPRG